MHTKPSINTCTDTYMCTHMHRIKQVLGGHKDPATHRSLGKPGILYAQGSLSSGEDKIPRRLGEDFLNDLVPFMPSAEADPSYLCYRHRPH